MIMSDKKGSKGQNGNHNSKDDDQSKNVGIATTAAPQVGIGTTDPSYKLDVYGAINSTNDVKINGTSVLTTAENDAVALAIALG